MCLFEHGFAQFSTGSGGGSSSISIGGSGTEVPLPIELLSFDVQQCNDNVCVSWSTASETNNHHFTLEKGNDGVNFDEIATVAGAGNSIKINNYFHTDDKPLKGVSYYRLKQTDYDGKFVYSSVKSVKIDKSSEFSFGIYPNPNNGSILNIAVQSERKEEVLVVVRDVTGKESFSKVLLTENPGNNIFAIDLENKLPAGTYFVSATSNQNIYNKLLIIR